MHRARLIPAAVALALMVGLAGCGGQPGGASASPSASTSGSTTPAPEPTPTPTPTAEAGADIALPGSCESIYSPAMLATLNADNPPLNDPGVTMTSTNIEVAFGVLEAVTAAGQSLRCSWGTPSEFGLATNVSLIDAEQAADIEAALVASSLDCAPYEDGTLCRIVVDNTDQDYGNVYGETHYLAGNAWIATSWLNFAPEGYTEDIVAALWG